MYNARLRKGSDGTRLYIHNAIQYKTRIDLSHPINNTNQYSLR